MRKMVWPNLFDRETEQFKRIVHLEQRYYYWANVASRARWNEQCEAICILINWKFQGRNKKNLSSVGSAFITKCLKTFKFYCLSIAFIDPRVIRFWDVSLRCVIHTNMYYSSENSFFSIRACKNSCPYKLYCALIWIVLSLWWPFYVL